MLTNSRLYGILLAVCYVKGVHITETTEADKPRIVMPTGTDRTRGSLKGFVWLFVIAFVLWLGFTSSLSPSELLTGCVVSLVVSALSASVYSRLGLPPLGVGRILRAIAYVPILFWEIIRANFDVAYRVLSPRLPINPGIVVIKTGLTSDVAKLILANSITLTPGTFTLDVEDDKLLIHWIDVKATDVEGATREVGERFERYLRPMFG
jgi:multicomponent Na+:H+ antiporter subunit E